MSTTRRELVGGAVAGAAGATLLGPARAGAASTTFAPAKPEVVPRGRAVAAGGVGGRVLVAHDRARSVAVVRRGRGRVVPLPGQPAAVAIAPDGRTAAASLGFWDRPGLALLDLVSGEVRGSVAAGDAPGAVAFTPDGRRLLVAGGEQDGELTVLDVAKRTPVRSVRLGAVPRGLAVAPDGRAAYVAMAGRGLVLEVDLTHGRIARRWRVGERPSALALRPDGRRLLITHLAREDESVTELDLRTGRHRTHQAGRHPSAVAYTRSGRPLAALGGEDAVVELAGRRPRRRHAVPPAPRGLAVAGRRAYTVSALDGDLGRVTL